MIADYLQCLKDNPVLYSRRLVLRPFSQTDAPDVLAYGSHPESLRYLYWQGAHTLEEAQASVNGYYSSRAGIYAIAARESNRCIGVFDLQVDAANEKATFSYLIHPAHWNKGFASETLAAVLHFAFSQLQLNRVEASHMAGNPASGHVMQKCGMLPEGIARKQMKVNGCFSDMAYYGITRAEWAEQTRTVTP